MKQNKQLIRKYIYTGAIFQGTFIVFWGGRLFFDLNEIYVLKVISWFGLFVMTLCMVRIYRFKNNAGLITSDMFYLTRHPVYHGMFLADFPRFLIWENVSSQLFWLSWIIMMLCMLTAGYFQEKETLERWGQEAIDYYKKTPRFIFEWIWKR